MPGESETNPYVVGLKPRGCREAQSANHNIVHGIVGPSFETDEGLQYGRDNGTGLLYGYL